MSSFIELCHDIRNKYDNECLTGATLKNILQSVQNLPMEEQIDNQPQIIKIIYHLKSYTNVNKVLTKEETQDVLNLFPKNKSFNTIIKNIMDDFSVYTTVGSLDNIIMKIESLSQKEQNKKAADIDKIKRTIHEYGNKDRSLSNKQSNRLLKVLSDCIPSKFQIVPNPSVVPNYNAISKPYYNTLSKPNYNTLSKPPKFEADDQISEIVYMLITNLNRDTLGSSLTNYVVDYFVYVNILLEDNYNRYKDITEEIKKCLRNHSWQCESDTSAGGFYSEPNATQLVNDLQTIINKYF